MKKFLFALILIALPLTGNAQEHMKFMGIPIDGTPAQFGQKLVTQKGMKEVVAEKVYSGKFFAQDCIISLYAPHNCLCSVNVYFPESSSWSNILTLYDALKRHLTAKYDIPSKVEEYFDNKNVNDDYSKFIELKNDRCHYSTSWQAPVGAIRLNMINFQLSSGSNPRVCLSYHDYINSIKTELRSSDDL